MQGIWFKPLGEPFNVGDTVSLYAILRAFLACPAMNAAIGSAAKLSSLYAPALPFHFVPQLAQNAETISLLPCVVILSLDFPALLSALAAIPSLSRSRASKYPDRLWLTNNILDARCFR
jgi:hypothetical protein